MGTKLVSRSSTLEAARTVYFIVVGLAIKQSLGLFAHTWPSKDFPNAPAWPSLARGVIAAGYLLTVIRFSHGVTLLYGHEQERIENSDLPSSTKISELSLFLVLLAIPFYLMADNITQLNAYIAWTAVMLVVDFVYVLRSNVVRRPLRRIFRVLGETEQGYAAHAAIWWLANDVALIITCITFFIGSSIGTTLALHPPARELLFAVVLILAAPADYLLNWDFYFGGRQDRRKQKFVFVISPLRDQEMTIYKENINRAQWYCRELMRWQGRFGQRVTPLASHAFFTYFLNDRVGIDRRLGLECTLAYLSACDVVHVYVPLCPRWPYRALLTTEEKAKPESHERWLRRVTKWVQSRLEKSVRKLDEYLGLKDSFASGRLTRFSMTLDKKDGPTMGMKYAVAAAKNHGLEIKYRMETTPTPNFIPPAWGGVKYEPETQSPGKSSESYFRGAARKKVYVCTRFRGNNFDGKQWSDQLTTLQDNTRLALWHCHELVRDENEAVAPFAPQAFYPYFWDFTDPKSNGDKVINNERWDAWFERSIEMLKVCDAVYIYTAEGLPPNEFDSSEGVRKVDRTAQKLGLEIQYRKELTLPEQERAKAKAEAQRALENAQQAQAAAATAGNRSNILQTAADNLQAALGADDQSVQAAQREAAEAKKCEGDLVTAAERKKGVAEDKDLELVKTTWDPAVPDF